jgi:hypothetical protein
MFKDYFPYRKGELVIDTILLETIVTGTIKQDSQFDFYMTFYLYLRYHFDWWSDKYEL